MRPDEAGIVADFEMLTIAALYPSNAMLHA
jgi:hypothetical protein